MRYAIVLAPEMIEDLNNLKANVRTATRDAIEPYLRHQPTEASRFRRVAEGPRCNSFSGPHAAGLVALMLSANPDLNAWDVKRLMEETCLDIGPKGRDSTFGAGLLQAREAVRAAKNARGERAGKLHVA